MPPAGLFETMAEKLGAPHVAVDDAGRVTGMSPKAGEWLGEDPQACTGRSAAEVLGAHDTEFQRLLSDVRSGSAPISACFAVSHCKGQRRTLGIGGCAFPVDDPRAGQVLLWLTDVTDSCVALLKAAQAERMVAVGMLGAGVAHEFNNIWASIHGYAELAKNHDKYANTLVDVALEQAERAAEIIHALLTFSSLRAELHPGVRLGPILRTIERLVGLEMCAKGIELAVEIEADPPVVGNEGMLQQVFLNLVVNAYHAMTTKGRIGIRLFAREGWAAVEVRDTGRGMSETQREHMFEPFFTTKGALGGSEEADGRGLGLTLTYNLVKTHGGRIEVESEPGNGSVFTVRIPVCETAFEAEGEAGRSDTDPPEVSGLRVLVIDDEEALHNVIRNLLSRQHVESVASASEGLDRLAEGSYDVVLLDLLLGGEMDGFEAFDRMTETCRDMPIVLLTGRAEDERLRRYADRAAGLVRKPFTADSIRRAIAAAVGSPDPP